MNTPFVSVIVPAKNAEKTIEKCINSILNLDYKDYEVIIIDDNSTDAAGSILKKYCHKVKTIIFSFDIGPSEARNIAAKEAKGEFLAFTDSDCLVDRFWLKELLACFRGGSIAGAGGIQLPPQDESQIGNRISLLFEKIGLLGEYTRKENGKIVTVEHNPSCCVMYRKDIFLKENGFLKDFWPGEDVELDYRLRKKGYELSFNPKAVVYHYRPDNFESFLRMMERYGRAQGCLVRKYGIFRKTQIIPFVSGILMLLILIIAAINLGMAVSAILMLGIMLYVYLKSGIFIGILALCGGFFWHKGFFKGWLFSKRQ